MLKLTFLITFGIISFACYSQIEIQNNVLSSSGGVYGNGIITVDYTFGETFTTTLEGSGDFYFTQGFEQPIRKKLTIDPVVSIMEILPEGFDVFPNPFSHLINILIPNNEKVDVLFYDISGRLVYAATISELQNSIDLSFLAPANYQLVLHTSSDFIGRMSIIKSY